MLSNWWYVFKCYQKHVPLEHRSWSYRQRLMKEYVSSINADIFCFQEVNPNSFEDDFSFMVELGFEHGLLEQSNNKWMRCAMFWKKTRFTLAAKPKSDPYRCLVTALKSTVSEHLVVVGTCHLSVGEDSGNRLRQLRDALDAMRKLITNTLKSSVDRVGVVLCGDFNSSPDSTATVFLKQGKVDPDYRDPSYPNVEVTQKTKKHVFTFTDAYADYYQPSPVPSTFIVPQLFPKLLKPVGKLQRNTELNKESKEGNQGKDESERAELTSMCADAVRAMFKMFSSDGLKMTAQEVEKWIFTIHGSKENRGLEGARQEALALVAMEKSHSSTLLLSDFLELYLNEAMTNPWSVEYDFYTCGLQFDIAPEHHQQQQQQQKQGVHPSSSLAPFQETFDYVYYTPQVLQLTTLRETMPDERRKDMEKRSNFLPDSDHCSDHLAVAAQFSFLPLPPLPAPQPKQTKKQKAVRAQKKQKK
eukprot:CAMPEP_0175146420 /NCGR_PEP_ID=MMETSP0087-20121206/15372_1 /TAXON_ID=136419 /ORGANISM="Unknown Unknown, Strain D1" /LENGTH=471 /DNA_ID=CAMNT_0016431387 /DNA_START=289 /DNA_END=1704 /DNA_ORIENTATION=+